MGSWAKPIPGQCPAQNWKPGWHPIPDQQPVCLCLALHSTASVVVDFSSFLLSFPQPPFCQRDKKIGQVQVLPSRPQRAIFDIHSSAFIHPTGHCRGVLVFFDFDPCLAALPSTPRSSLTIPLSTRSAHIVAPPFHSLDKKTSPLPSYSETTLCHSSTPIRTGIHTRQIDYTCTVPI
ncbi:hypothetical protein VTJ04DRAFT_3772 [Mycothermus thermophilus]|uniref:uncharacterized protein n=1 Tax=Humicola insolens TaxID=85995 RepID=UPI0037427395